MEYKIGIGYDIHRLIEGRKLFLGGIEIPYVKGLLGHSDGDALLHAICDALLGALSEGDIGERFPDTDQEFHNICSLELLKNVAQTVKEKGYSISNIDTVVIAQEPVLLPFKRKMQDKIAGALEIEAGCVNIKAKTQEGMGEIGRKEAIASYAVTILKKGV